MRRIILLFLIMIITKDISLALDLDIEKEQAELNNAKSQGKRLLVKEINVTDIDSADGVNFEVIWAPIDDKHTIKYIYFTVRPYNAVGDVQSCEIRGHSDFIGKITGPIEAFTDYFQAGHWEAAWYNSTITCIKLIKVHVVYTDGSHYTYLKELPKILSVEMKNSCKYIQK